MLDDCLHEKRLAGLSYIAPYLTRNRLDEPIETYWQRWETKIDENTTSSSSTTRQRPARQLHLPVPLLQPLTS